MGLWEESEHLVLVCRAGVALNVERVVVVVGVLDDKVLVDLDDGRVAGEAVGLEGPVLGDVSVVVEVVVLEKKDEVCDEDLDGEEELGLVIEDGPEVVDKPGVEQELDEGEEGAAEVEPDHEDGPAVGGLAVVVVEDLRDVLAHAHADLDEPERRKEVHPVEAPGDGLEPLRAVDVRGGAHDVRRHAGEDHLRRAAEPLVVVAPKPPAVRLREHQRVREEVVQPEHQVVEPDQRPLAVLLVELPLHHRRAPHHPRVQRVKNEPHHVEVHVVDRDALHRPQLRIADHRRVVGHPPSDNVHPSDHVRRLLQRHACFCVLS